jgi:8-oxo-dGTP pyrophosphatase MutT (NUDIX family)
MEQGSVLSVGQPGRAGLTRDFIAKRLASGPGSRGRSDAATALLLGGEPRPEERAPDRQLVPAAVLVPLVSRPDGLTVLLTQRTAHLSNHAGQVSFPGGRIEEHDCDPVAAALRETEEEIGLPASSVELLGWLDDYVTGTGFRIHPVVGLVEPPLTLSPDPFEVAEVFEVPLDFVLDPANHQRHVRMFEGRKRPYYAIPYEGRFIWGATAGMLINLFEVLRA